MSEYLLTFMHHNKPVPQGARMRITADSFDQAVERGIVEARKRADRGVTSVVAAPLNVPSYRP